MKPDFARNINQKRESGTPSPDMSKVAVRCAYDKMVDIAKLKPNPANPNIHPDIQIDRLALLIKEHGWRHPITVSKRSGKVVSGHCRLLAARKLNLKQVPVDYQDFKSDAEEYAVLIVDNVVHCYLTLAKFHWSEGKAGMFSGNRLKWILSILFISMGPSWRLSSRGAKACGIRLLGTFFFCGARNEILGRAKVAFLRPPGHCGQNGLSQFEFRRFLS